MELKAIDCWEKLAWFDLLTCRKTRLLLTAVTLSVMLARMRMSTWGSSPSSSLGTVVMLMNVGGE